VVSAPPGILAAALLVAKIATDSCESRTPQKRELWQRSRNAPDLPSGTSSL
jgi:hypothetical protein